MYNVYVAPAPALIHVVVTPDVIDGVPDVMDVAVAPGDILETWSLQVNLHPCLHG